MSDNNEGTVLVQGVKYRIRTREPIQLNQREHVLRFSHITETPASEDYVRTYVFLKETRADAEVEFAATDIVGIWTTDQTRLSYYEKPVDDGVRLL